MRHSLDRPIASDLSQQVLEMRRRLGEIGPSQFDNTLGRLKVISGYHPRLFIADVDEGTDTATPPVDEPSPTWHFHGRKR